MLRSFSQLLLSGIFIFGGWHAFLEPGGRPKAVAKFNIPQPEQAVVLNGATMLVAGSALGLGFFPRLAATVLLGSLIPTTIVGHSFWREQDPTMRQNQSTQFAKNLGLIGGLLLIIFGK